MSLQMNQLKMIPVQGQLDLAIFNNIITGQVDTNVVTPLVPGQAVKLITTSNGIPIVTPLTANTDATFAFVSYNIKDQSFPARSRVELALAGSTMQMTAGAAINAGAKIEVVYTTNKVITNAGTNPVAGYALDHASADGDLIRVTTLSPYSSPFTIADIAGLQTDLDVLTAGVLADVKQVSVVATLAEINAGKTLIAAVTGKKIIPLNIVQRSAGAFGGATAVVVESTNGTPVVVTSTTIAAFGDSADVILPSDTHVTLGAGYGIALGTSDGVQVVKTGSSASGGTNITFTITYALV